AADSPKETETKSSSEYVLNIPRMTLLAALDELVRQTNVQLLVVGDLPSLFSGPLKGSYTIDEALILLLQNTGAIYGRGTGARYWVRPRPAPPPGEMSAVQSTTTEPLLPIGPSPSLEEWGMTGDLVLVLGQRRQVSTMEVPDVVMSAKSISS